MESLRLDLTGHFETLIRLYLIAFISNDDNRLFCVADSAFNDLELFQLFPFYHQFDPMAELSNLGHAQWPQNLTILLRSFPIFPPLAFLTFATDTNSSFARVAP